MAMLDEMLAPNAYPGPEVGPAENDAILPFELQAAEAARRAAALRAGRAGRHGVASPFIEGQPDASTLGMLNASAPDMMPSAVMSPAASPASAEPLPTPVPFAAAPVPPDAAAAPAAPAGAGGVPSWLGMLNAPLDHLMPPAADAAALPPTAAPVSGPAAASPGAMPQTSLLGRIHDMINDRRGTLLALGAGLAGAQNLGQGLSRGFALAGPAMQQDIKQQQLNASLPIIRDKLIQGGMSPTDATATATAAVGNPALMQQVMAQFGPKAYQHVTVKDMMGGEHPLAFDPSRGVYVSPGGGSALPNVGVPSDMLAPGVKQVDPSLTGQDYLKQFSPEVQSATKAYIEGRSMPTGNPRRGWSEFIKQTAMRVGDQSGKPVDDALFSARRTLRNDLEKNSPGSIGGQLVSGGAALKHLGEASEAASELGNVSGFGIAPVARLINSARGLATEQAAKVNALNDVLGHYGQEITKYYTNSPGGEAERMRFLKAMDASKSNLEIAGAIRAERNLIPGKLDQQIQKIHDELGPEEAAKWAKEVDLPGKVERINAALAKLDPTGPEARMLAGTRSTPSAAAAAPPGAIPPGQPLPPRVTYDPATNMFIPRP